MGSTSHVGEKRWTAFALGLIWLIATAYNIEKPFHIDDTAYILMSRWIAAHPLHPMRGLLNWSGTEQPFYKLLHPHLYLYLLAGWGKLFGFTEIPLHALQSLTALCSIVLFHRIAKVVVPESALWLTALLALGPAFITEQNLMIDVPLLATWLLFFLQILCKTSSDQQTRRYVFAALACSAAILIKYSSLILVLILIFSLVIERRRSLLWVVLIPIGAVAGWSLFNYFDYRGIHILTKPDAEPHTIQRLMILAREWIEGMGALTCLGMVWVVERSRKLSQYRVAVYTCLLVAFALLIVAKARNLISDHVSDTVLLVAFVGNGIALCLVVFRQALQLPWRAIVQRRLNERSLRLTYLLVWIVSTSVLYIKAVPFMAARHILTILSPLFMVTMLDLGRAPSKLSKRIGLGLTVIVSFCLCVADWRFASFFKNEAANLPTASAGTGRVWSAGHWGWQYYATERGFEEFDIKSSRPNPGDLYLLPDVDSQQPERAMKLKLIHEDTQSRPLLDLFCSNALYLYRARPGPWTLRTNCIHNLRVFQIEAVE